VPLEDSPHSSRVAVLYEGRGDCQRLEKLAHQLSVPLLQSGDPDARTQVDFFLAWRNDCLTLLQSDSLQRGGLFADFDVRGEQQRSWPAPKKGPLAQAIGRKTRLVVDATAGWGQDSFQIFRMGYEVLCIERSPVMAELLWDGLQRLAAQAWMRELHLTPPQLLTGNALEILATLTFQPDCIYLDPMFPPKRKKSALARKSMRILRELLGDDDDREQLFAAAWQAAGKRVVVKRPDYAQPLAGKPNESFQGKLVRYDVYLKMGVSAQL